jgi:hypothetical protein
MLCTHLARVPGTAGTRTPHADGFGRVMPHV